MGPRGALLERAEEIEALDRALTAARDGHGAAVVLRGAAGLGASCLLSVGAELAAARGMAVVLVRADHLGDDVPFGLARRLLAPLLDDAADRQRLLADERASAGPLFSAGWTRWAGDETEVREALCAIVTAAARLKGRPHALVLDDLQWADRASLRLLLSLVGRLHDLPVAVLCSRRPELDGAEADLLDLLEDDRATTVRTLRPLSDDGVRRHVCEELGHLVDDDLARECARVTGGNPFYLAQLLRQLGRARLDTAPQVAEVVGTVPSAVVRSIGVRLDRLSPAAVAVARALAVLGDGAELATTARLAGLTAAEADAGGDALVAAGIVEPGEPLRFEAPMVGRAVHEGMAPFARTRLHRAAADLLLADGAAVERVAAQLRNASPQGDARAAEVLRDAAALAQARAEPVEAVALLERALAEDPPPALRAALLVDLARADVRAGSAGAAARLEEALALLDDPVEQARTLHAHAAVLHHAGDFEGTARACERGLTLVPADHPVADQLRAGLIGAGLLHPPLLARARGELQQILDGLDTTPAHVPALCAQLAIYCAERGEPDDRVRTMAEQAFAQDPLVDGDPMGMSLGYAAQALVWVDALDVATPRLATAAAAARQRGAFMALAIARLNQAIVAYHQGRLADAVTHAVEAQEVHEHGWTDSTWGSPVLALAHVERGDLTAARQAVAVGERADPARSDRGMLLEARARLALASGEPDAALADALAVGELIEDGYQSTCARLFRWRVVAATAAHRLGRRAEARELSDTALGEARALATPRQLGESLTVAGLVVGGAAGLGLHEEAVAVLDRSPSRLQLAHSLLELGAARRRHRQRAAALEPLTHALELAAELGAAGLVVRARHELGLLGTRPRRPARTGPASLTPGQRAVVDLAAAGHGNVEIAQQLFIARKTVESHLASAYRKLGIRTRHELEGALRDHRTV